MWLKFPGLILHLWSQAMLSKIASMIGRPLFTDMMTARRSRLAFARVCVEISIENQFLDKVLIQDSNGKLIE